MEKRGLLFRLLFIFGLFLISFPSLTAISLSGNKLSPIIYEPGKSIVNHYTISDTEYETQVTVGGNLMEYISVSEVKDNQFDLIINFPDEYIPAGSYSFSLNVQEVPSESSPLSSRLSVTKVFIVQVYSDKKEIFISLNAPSVNEGNPVNFKITVESRGYQDIDKVKGVINVYDSRRQLLAALSTEEKPLPALKSTALNAIFPTVGLEPAEYYAEAIVDYDGSKKRANATFRIGNLDLILQNYTSELKPGFNEISIWVKNNWGNQLNNVYAELFLAEEKLLQTAPINLEAWTEGLLEGIIKVEQPPGTYPGMIRLYFEGESKEEKVIFTVAAQKPEEFITENVFNWLFLIMVCIIVIILIATILQMKHRQKKKNEL